MVHPLFPQSLDAKHRIYAGTEQREKTGCWEWIYSRQTAGYGQVRWGGRQVTTHRLAWTAWYGPIPDGAHVLHKCDNPPCCNPCHLMIGDHSDNMADMGRKRRNWLSRKKDLGEAVPAPVVPSQNRARGENVGTSKLTPPLVLMIYRDKRKQRDIAKDHGISQCHVWRIKRGLSWAHITRHSATR